MRILFDQGTPVPLRRHFHPHIVDTVAERGWATLENGILLKQAEADGYDAFITTDSNLRYQQNLLNRTVRILVLTTTSWPKISPKAQQIRAVLDCMAVGGYKEIEI